MKIFTQASNTPSEIENQLTREEKIVLEIYRNPKKHEIKRLIRLSVQYGVGTAIFTGLATRSKRTALCTSRIFYFSCVSYPKDQRSVGYKNIMPGIIEKYEKTLRDLKNINHKNS